MTNRQEIQHYQVAVIGGGIVGLATALGLAREGVRTAFISPLAAEPDGKTSALLSGSIEILRNLGVWDKVTGFAYPLKTMRIVDGTNRLIRAPQIDFNASEIGLEAFGYNVENKRLAALLEAEIDRLDMTDRYPSAVIDIAAVGTGSPEGACRLETSGGDVLAAEIVIAADGRNSVVRQTLGIGQRDWHYPQIALVGNLTHTIDHHDVSTEFHTESGPFTAVPLGNKRSSLVWVCNEDGAAELQSLDQASLDRRVENRMQSFLGKVKMDSPLKGFPLGGMVANRFGRANVMLAGEAAHVFPPIGAQGLNLGLRDVATAIRLVTEPDCVPQIVGDAYHRERSSDVHSRTASVDILNRSLLSEFLPVQVARSFGLYAMGSIGPLRRFMMREGIAPGSGLISPFPARRGGDRSILKSGH